MSDRIKLTVEASDEWLEALDDHQTFVTAETLAINVVTLPGSGEPIVTVSAA